MIAKLSGMVEEKFIDHVVIDVSGVGYGVKITTSDYGSLHTGDITKVYIYEQIKDDTHDLYGFKALESKKLFEQLLSVKNVGPKVALAVLDLGTVQDVSRAISGGEVKTLQTAKGVGKRAAEQIVVELRDRVGLATESAEGIVGRSGIGTQDEATQALVALGYSDVDALELLAKVNKDLPVEERIKQALKGRT